MTDDIHSLLEVVDRLLAPNGCPWDREQTPQSWARMVFEESCEVLDALSADDSALLADEVGDVVSGLLFLAKAAAAEKRFSSWTDPFLLAAEKLRRRHPHVFASDSPIDSQTIERQWEEIKAAEAHHKHRKSLFDGISSSLPALALMQKLVHKANKSPESMVHLEEFAAQKRPNPEEELARQIAQLVIESERAGIHVEQALRDYFGRCRAHLVANEKQRSA